MEPRTAQSSSSTRAWLARSAPLRPCAGTRLDRRSDPGRLQARTRIRFGTGLTLVGTLVGVQAAQACWDHAARRYGVSADLLVAIARTESGLDPQAIGRNANGSRDIGLMQINSTWLPTLARHGIREQDLHDPCTSIQVGAWILAGNVQRLGYTWNAVGAYNAVSPQRRRAYVERVLRELNARRPSRPSATSPPRAGIRARDSPAPGSPGARRSG